jgi:parallel beta-helix repeat protein
LIPKLKGISQTIIEYSIILYFRSPVPIGWIISQIGRKNEELERKKASGFALILLLTSMLISALSLQPVAAVGAIYIRPDGSVDPPTAPIERNGTSYALVDSIHDSVVIQKNSIVFDGAGYTIQGTIGSYTKGVELVGSWNVTLTNIHTVGFYYGIYLYSCSGINILGNVMTDNEYGIRLEYSSGNSIFRNTITRNSGGITLLFSFGNYVSENKIVENSGEGVYLPLSFNNTISGNNITDNNEGVILVDSSTTIVRGNTIAANELGVVFGSSSTNVILENDLLANKYGIFFIGGSSGNLIYHNNFLNNTHQAYDSARNPPPIEPSICSWDIGYPYGGNYWSDYVDEDLKSGPYQNASGSDNIWDHPYEIDVANIDNYPLVDIWSRFPRTLSGLKTKTEEFGSKGGIDNQGIVRSLVAKLNAAQKLVEKGKADDASHLLTSFVNQVQVLTEIHITKEAAEILVDSAEYLRSSL